MIKPIAARLEFLDEPMNGTKAALSSRIAKHRRLNKKLKKKADRLLAGELFSRTLIAIGATAARPATISAQTA